MSVVKSVASIAVLALAASLAVAQDPVPSLQDLVGARGSSGEQALQDRGFNWVGTEKSGNDSYSYWRESENGQCIVVRTSEGRYASIVYAPDSDCQNAAKNASGAGGQQHAAPGSFKTVCGVMVGGEDHAYLCTVEDHYQDGRKASTTLRFPDQTLKMVWKSANQVELHFEGMVPKSARYSNSEGETNFVFEDKTYYYFSDPGRAASEVQNFRH